MTVSWNDNAMTRTPLCVVALLRVPVAGGLSPMMYQAKGFAIDAHDPGGSDG
jgi:hypothetical protein